MKVIGFFDTEETKNILDLAKTKLKTSEWIGSGSMLLLKTENNNEYEVYLLRGIVTLNKREVKETKKERN